MPSVVIAGASGVVGNAAVERFLEHSGWDVVALSRRRPEIDSTRAYTHLSVDLRDADAAKSALGGLKEVTHLVYAALYEKPGLIPGWSEQDQMDTNLQMLKNTLEPLLAANPALRHVTLLQGTKAYGIHLHPMPIPAREKAPRDDHANFYWLQEDYLRGKAAETGFAWTILRPQLIIGRSWGVAMNLAPIIGAYAAICREEGRPFAFPGGVPYVWEAVDSRLVADVIHWAGGSPLAVNEHFNVTNGDVFAWRDLWPGMAEVLGVEPAPDDAFSMAEFLESKGDVWSTIVKKHGLRDIPLSDILGESHYYADFCFAFGATEAPPPAFSSRIKLSQAGFTDVYDTQETFRFWLQDLIGRRVLPRADS
ncbi:SDR family oxidoreductase [Baekduia soli]|uniref:SDR family oxidoreductase n=1 Tax=Baekduia soli TaxID=496014 RepID=A0A5B8U0I9_9ACTN|nr:SDR family oxidoreductase [Baekduia soli]QEC46533.1 SDR family oxidoreductase [Baekduia soli]